MQETVNTLRTVEQAWHVDTNFQTLTERLHAEVIQNSTQHV